MGNPRLRSFMKNITTITACFISEHTQKLAAKLPINIRESHVDKLKEETFSFRNIHVINNSSCSCLITIKIKQQNYSMKIREENLVY